MPVTSERSHCVRFACQGHVNITTRPQRRKQACLSLRLGCRADKLVP